MTFRELFRPPNLLSLSRVVLAPLTGYFLWRPENWAVGAAIGLVIIVAITDGLDGYLARRSRQVTPLGIALDPIADKVFAAVLVLCLVLFREFPWWLAALVIGRDLLILIGGTLLIRSRQTLTLPSNLTGKWAFASLAVLLGAHIIRFNFSITLMTPLVTILLIASLFVYGRNFVRMWRSETVAPFRDRPSLKLARVSLCLLVAALHVWKFWAEFLK